MQPEYLTNEHLMFRDAVRHFVAREIVPYHGQWERDGIVPRALWLKAGKMGLLGMDVPEEYGGPGIDDFRYGALFLEELARAGASGPGFAVQNDLVIPYLLAFANQEQKQRWLPKLVTGEYIASL